MHKIETRQEITQRQHIYLGLLCKLHNFESHICNSGNSLNIFKSIVRCDAQRRLLSLY
jgi:hypothetical protein